MILPLSSFKQVIYLNGLLLFLIIISTLLTLTGWICNGNINEACGIFFTENSSIFLWAGVLIGVLTIVAGVLTMFYYFNKN